MYYSIEWYSLDSLNNSSKIDNYELHLKPDYTAN